MNRETALVFEKMDAALASNELAPKARAFLLLKLCAICSVFLPDRAKQYWRLLSAVASHVPADEQSHLNDLRQLMGERPAPSSGFAGERIAEINYRRKEPWNQRTVPFGSWLLSS